LVVQGVVPSGNPSAVLKNRFHLSATESAIICTELDAVFVDDLLHIPIEVTGQRVFLMPNRLSLKAGRDRFTTGLLRTASLIELVGKFFSLRL
jgi:hypothetical protein